jgi:PAS domain S-box-containing protein
VRPAIVGLVCADRWPMDAVRNGKRSSGESDSGRMTNLSHRGTRGTLGSSALVPSKQSQHVVQFYEADEFLTNSVGDFLSAGLVAGAPCIVIATAAHRADLERRLIADGLDLAAAQARGDYCALDAAETLAKFMSGDALDTVRFAEVIGGMIGHAAQGQQRWHGQQGQARQPHVFGEMVALLWEDGRPSSAIELEALWNELSASLSYPFLLCCAYPMRLLAGEANAEQFAAICRSHSHVIPDESYSALTTADARTRAITRLQQKAASLEAEIAERQQAEERLRISENRYRRLFEASTDGLLMVDPDTQAVIEANAVLATWLGSTPARLLGLELWQTGLFPSRTATLEVLRELEEQRIARRDVVLAPAEGGQVRSIEFVSTRFRANGHDIIQCNLRDVTERNQLEARKNAFISMASHELKTPVTSLKGFTQLLQRRLQRQQVDPQTMLFLDRMDAQLNKLTGLISDLLDVSKMQEGKLPYRETRFDLDELARETIENVQAAITTHQVRIEGATGAQVSGDRDRLGQVLINLLTNAVKYSPGADAVVVRLSADQQWAEVAVQDFGIGIAARHHERIFEQFYQVAEPQEGGYPGLGIGLYIAHTLVERHGGRLWLESRKGAGSTFHFTLPTLPNPAPEADELSAAEHAEVAL